MPDFKDFLDQLDQAGIEITGRDQLSPLDGNPHWPQEIVHLVKSGKKKGVHFWRSGPHPISDEDLGDLVRGYPFGSEDCPILVQNIGHRKDPYDRTSAQRATTFLARLGEKKGKRLPVDLFADHLQKLDDLKLAGYGKTFAEIIRKAIDDTHANLSR